MSSLSWPQPGLFQLPAGVSPNTYPPGQVLLPGSGGGGGGGLTSPLTTKGDLWGWTTTNARVPVGSNGTVLTADSTQATGVSWAAAASSLPYLTGTAPSGTGGSAYTFTPTQNNFGGASIRAELLSDSNASWASVASSTGILTGTPPNSTATYSANIAETLTSGAFSGMTVFTRQLINITGSTVFATWDPANKSTHVILSGGNLTATQDGISPGQEEIGWATVPFSALLKYYWEATITFGIGVESGNVGVANLNQLDGSGGGGVQLGDSSGNSAGGGYVNDGNCYYNGSVVFTFSGGFTSPVTLGFTFDGTTGTFATTADGSTYHTIATGLSMTGGLGGTWYPAVGVARATTSITANFGASPFTFPVPAGYQPGVY